MNIIVNNQSHNIKSQSLTEMIEELSIETKGVAIALNNKVIPRAQWSETSLSDADNVVIVSAVFGG